MIVKSKAELKKIINQAQRAGKKVLVKRGVFDIIHPGHISAVKSFNRIADVVIIMVQSDKLVKKRKGENRPVNSQKQRAEVVDALKGVDYTYLEKSTTREEFKKLLEYLRPDILAITHVEHKLDKMYQGYSWKLKVIPENSQKGLSSTAIINKIKKK
ncbi:MAG: adenylyltransferase/cytidyltransferase family protein [Patescibacteria group bacterium]|nr:adenylyltransferase/cytidyltransferase family protein [Patescibacteria group bacterium]